MSSTTNSTPSHGITNLPNDKEKREAFQKVANSGNWEELWKKKATNWDLGQSAYALIDLIQDGQVPVSQDNTQNPKQILVPGCGSGYDVVSLAAPGRHVIGLDLSSTAIQVANSRTQQLHPDLNQDLFSFVCGDFFDFEVPKGGFDFVWEYTFMCALPPTMRQDWAKRMGEIVKPGGLLCTLIFPIGNHTHGPPYAVSPEIFQELLDPYFERVFLKDCRSVPARQGKEKLAMWKRK